MPEWNGWEKSIFQQLGIEEIWQLYLPLNSTHRFAIRKKGEPNFRIMNISDVQRILSASDALSQMVFFREKLREVCLPPPLPRGC